MCGSASWEAIHFWCVCTKTTKSSPPHHLHGYKCNPTRRAQSSKYLKLVCLSRYLVGKENRLCTICKRSLIMFIFEVFLLGNVYITGPNCIPIRISSELKAHEPPEQSSLSCLLSLLLPWGACKSFPSNWNIVCIFWGNQKCGTKFKWGIIPYLWCVE